MPRCAVATCNNYYFKTSERKGDVVYHVFPKDKELAKTWFKLCDRSDRKSLYPISSDSICSKHFTSEDYNEDHVYKACNLPQRKAGFLKKFAIPSLELPILQSNIVKSSQSGHNVSHCNTSKLKK